MQSVVSQGVWFVAVGCVAAATHWAVAVGSIARLGIPPALANALGWTIAVVVSFSGHHCLTFRQQETSVLPAFRRFLLLSLSGFVINELAFVFLLQATDLPYYWLLTFILAAVAILTFLVSRFWVFRDNRQAAEAHPG